LRTFTDLDDFNRQSRQWLAVIANLRQHSETRQRPVDRFSSQSLRPLPRLLPDYRDAADVLVHKDIRIYFDGNRHCAPPSPPARRNAAENAGNATVEFSPEAATSFSSPRTKPAAPVAWDFDDQKEVAFKGHLKQIRWAADVFAAPDRLLMTYDRNGLSGSGPAQRRRLGQRFWRVPQRCHRAAGLRRDRIQPRSAAGRCGYSLLQFPRRRRRLTLDIARESANHSRRVMREISGLNWYASPCEQLKCPSHSRGTRSH
jgi:hypothetical protein